MYAMRTGAEVEDAELPEAADIMLRTRMWNEFHHTNETPEQVAERDPLFFELLVGLKRGMAPEVIKHEHA